CARRVPATIVALDGWTVSDQLAGRGRFDMAGLVAFGEAAALRAPTHLTVPACDRGTRRPIPAAEPLLLASGDCIIFARAVGFPVGPLMARAGHRVFVEAGAAVRHARFRADYIAGGMAPADVEALLAAREQDEVNLLRTMSAAATAVVRTHR